MGGGEDADAELVLLKRRQRVGEGAKAVAAAREDSGDDGATG
jgi:hypothetical protein